jgi:hypothetical protein
MTERERHPQGESARWLFYLAAWGVSSVMAGVLLGRHLKQVSADYPLAEPSATPTSKIAGPRPGAS